MMKVLYKHDRHRKSIREHNTSIGFKLKLTINILTNKTDREL